jgi:hypothetical protein
MDLATLSLSFLLGVLFHMLWNWMVNTGYTIIMMKAAINDCVIFMAKSLQDVYEIKYLKEEAMRLVNRDEKYIEWQSILHEKEIRSLKTTCIRNFINAIPPKYNHLIEFHDWQSAMEYIDKVIKEGK